MRRNTRRSLTRKRLRRNCKEEQGHFTEHGYISLSGDEWNHERPAEPEKKPSIRERLEQGKKECAEKHKAQPYKEKAAPEL